MNILVLHGPNLNLLGAREPDVYGGATLEDINEMLAQEAAARGVVLRTFQSNSEGDLVSKIHEEAGWADALIINPAAYTHTSVALRDALVTERLAPVAIGQIAGFGIESYRLALIAATRIGAS